MAEKRKEKKIPFLDKQVDAGNSFSIYNANENVNIAQQFLEVLAAFISATIVGDSIRMRALVTF